MLQKVFLGLMLSLFIFVSSNNYAQNMEVGILAGGTYYLGELNPGKQFLFTKPAFGGLMRVNFDDRWAAKLNVLIGKVEGDDYVSKANEARNLRFRSSITEISILFEFNFLEYFTGSQSKFFSPFLFAGPGIFFFNPEAPYNDSYYNLRELGTEGTIDNYDLYGLSAAFGLGIKYSATNRIGLALEWGLRKTFTDYIDDISEEYYFDFEGHGTVTGLSAAQFLSDPSAVKHAPGVLRGNPQTNDWYSFAGVSVTYRFSLGEKTTCRDFENSNN